MGCDPIVFSFRFWCCSLSLSHVCFISRYVYPLNIWTRNNWTRSCTHQNRLFQENLAKNCFVIDKSIHCFRYSGILKIFFIFPFHVSFHFDDQWKIKCSNWIYIQIEKKENKYKLTEKKECVHSRKKEETQGKERANQKTQKKKKEKYCAYMSMNNILKRLILFSCDNGKHTEYTEQQSNRHRE